MMTIGSLIDKMYIHCNKQVAVCFHRGTGFSIENGEMKLLSTYLQFVLKTSTTLTIHFNTGNRCARLFGEQTTRRG